LEKFRNFMGDFLSKIQKFLFPTQRVMPETLELLESVSTADIPDLLILYLELKSSDRGDSSWNSSVISLPYTGQNLIIFC
jgi:hypothetical protein